jgi:hypothetical protein
MEGYIKVKYGQKENTHKEIKCKHGQKKKN